MKKHFPAILLAILAVFLVLPLVNAQTPSPIEKVYTLTFSDWGTQTVNLGDGELVKEVSWDICSKTTGSGGYAGHNGQSMLFTTVKYSGREDMLFTSPWLGGDPLYDYQGAVLRNCQTNSPGKILMGVRANSLEIKLGPPASLSIYMPVYVTGTVTIKTEKIVPSSQEIIDNLYSTMLNYWSYDRQYRCAIDKVRGMGYRVEYEIVPGGPAYKMPVLYSPAGFPKPSIATQPLATPPTIVPTGCENPLLAPNTLPFGILEKADSTEISGWAYDADYKFWLPWQTDPHQAKPYVTVRIEGIGANTGQTFSKTVLANQPRLDLVTSKALPDGDSSHGFKVSTSDIQPDLYIIKVFASDPQTNQEVEIYQSPKTVAFGAPQTPSGTISTIAGAGNSLGDGGPPLLSVIKTPGDIDTNVYGTIYFVDSEDKQVTTNGVTTNVPVYKIRAIGNGVINTVAGGGTVLGDGGPAIQAELKGPLEIAADNQGDVYIADSGDHRIRKFTAFSGITTIAGTGTAGFSGDGGPATSAQLSKPSGIAVDPQGNVYISDTGNNRIRKLTPDTDRKSYTISTIAGTGGYPSMAGPAETGSAISVRINPKDIAIYQNNLYVIDDGRHRVAKLTPNADKTSYTISTFTEYPLSMAFFRDITVDSSENIYLVDQYGMKVIKVDKTGAASVFAGTGVRGFSGDGGPAVSAQVGAVRGIVVDKTSGNFYLTDDQSLSSAGNRIRVIDPAGTIIDPAVDAITTIAGGNTYYTGDSGPAIASLTSPKAVAFNKVDGSIFIAESDRVRKIDKNGVITKIAGGDGGTTLNNVKGIALDSAGNVYLANSDQNRITKLTPDGKGGYALSTIAGSGIKGFSGSDGDSATSASLDGPSSVAVDSNGKIYFVDKNNNRVRTLTPSGTSYTIKTIAGGGASTGDNIEATSAMISPSAIVIDSGGNIYIADDEKIRQLVPVQGSQDTYTISTIAGTGKAGATYSGDGTNALSADLGQIGSLATYNALIYFSDFYNPGTGGTSFVRKFVKGGKVSTIAGGGTALGDGGPASSSNIDWVNGLDTDSSGNLYIAHATGLGGRIRKITFSIPSPTPTPGISPTPGPPTVSPTPTPPTPKPPPVGLANIAPSSTIAAQSLCYPTECWDNLIDEDIAGWDGTVTASKGPLDKEVYAVLDLPGTDVYNLQSVKMLVDTGVANFDRWVKDFRVQVSGDGVTWTTVLTAEKTTGAGFQEFALPVGTTARFVKIILDSPMNPSNNPNDPNNPGFQIGELEVWGSTGALPPPPGTPTPTPPPVNNADCNGLSGVPDSVEAGKTFLASASFKNIGTKVWDPSTHKMIAQAQGQNIWGLNEVSLLNQVNPDSYYSFSFNPKAPTAPGSYQFAWQMADGSTPFGDTGCRKAVTVTAPVTCTDSDNGINKDVKGTVTLQDVTKKETHTDYCSDSSVLVEYSCDTGTQIGFNSYGASPIACPTGTSCADGACVQPSPAPTCTDSDGSDKGDVKGTTVFEGKTYIDTCVSDFEVFENSCPTPFTKNVAQYKCSAGKICKDGACITGTIQTPTPTPPFGIVSPTPAPPVFLGIISTVAGTGNTGFSGDGGQAKEAMLARPQSVSLDQAGNVYIADYSNNRIRKVDVSTGIIKTIAGSDSVPGFSGEGALATQAKLAYPSIFVDKQGTVYIADLQNNRVRKLTLNTDGTYTISTEAGIGTACADSKTACGDGPAFSAQLKGPESVVADSQGNIYLSDTGNNKIRKIDKATKTVSTVAGTGVAGYSGDCTATNAVCPATSAQLNYPAGIAVDSLDNIYFGDASNNRIRKIEKSTGKITTVAGTGQLGYSGDGGLATSADLRFPYWVSVDASDNLYISDTANDAIRKVDKATGKITTIAGIYSQSGPQPGYSNDGELSTLANLNSPRGTATDSSGNIYIADQLNDRIRKITLIDKIPPPSPLIRDWEITRTISNNPLSVEVCIDSDKTIGELASTEEGLKAISFTKTSFELRDRATGSLQPANVIPLAQSAGNPNSKCMIYTDKTGSSSVVNSAMDSPGSPSANAYTVDVRADSTDMLTEANEDNNKMRCAYDTCIPAGKFDLDLVEAKVVQNLAKYSVSVKICASADPSTKILKKRSTTDSLGSYVAFPLKIDVIDENGNANPAQSSVSAFTKNDQDNCQTISTGDMTDQNSAIYEKTKKLNVAVDPNSMFPESNEDNNKLYCVNNVCSKTAATPTPIITPTVSPTPTPATPTPVKTPTPTPSVSPTPTPIAVISPTPTPGPVTTGTMTTVAGGGDLTGTAAENVLATSVRFAPQTVAVDSSGNMYISDWVTNKIMKVDKVTGKIFTIAGSGQTCANIRQDPNRCGDGGPALNAKMNPMGLVVDLSGNIFVSDKATGAVRKLEPNTDKTIYTISTVSSIAGTTVQNIYIADAVDVDVDSTGNMFAVSYGNKQIHKLVPDGKGGYSDSIIAQDLYWSGKVPQSISLDSSGNAYVSHTDGDVIKLTPEEAGYRATVLATSTSMSNPNSVAVDKSGNVYVADRNNNRIKRIDAKTGVIQIIAGTSTAGFSGDNELADKSQLNQPSDVALDSLGNLYIVDSLNQRVRKIYQATQFQLPAVTPTPTPVPLPPIPTINTILGTASVRGSPYETEFDQSGNIYFASSSDHTIRKIDTTGTSTIFAGIPYAGGFAGDNSYATKAQLKRPEAIALDSSGNLYIADSENYRIRRVDANTKIITTMAGNGQACYRSVGSTERCGDDGSPFSAKLGYTEALAVDSIGNVYIGSKEHIRKIDKTTGQISTFAGSPIGESGFTGADGIPAISARFKRITDIVADSTNNLYVVDNGNNVAYKIDNTPSRRVTRIAGTGTAGYSGDNGPSNEARLKTPFKIAIDATGNVYISDTQNFRIRRLTPNGKGSYTISTAVGTGEIGSSGEGGPGNQARLHAPYGLSADSVGNVYIAETYLWNIKKATYNSGGPWPVKTNCPKPADCPAGDIQKGIDKNSAGCMFVVCVSTQPPATPLPGVTCPTKPTCPAGDTSTEAGRNSNGCTVYACILSPPTPTPVASPTPTPTSLTPTPVITPVPIPCPTSPFCKAGERQIDAGKNKLGCTVYACVYNPIQPSPIVCPDPLNCPPNENRVVVGRDQSDCTVYSCINPNPPTPSPGTCSTPSSCKQGETSIPVGKNSAGCTVYACVYTPISSPKPCPDPITCPVGETRVTVGHTDDCPVFACIVKPTGSPTPTPGVSPTPIPVPSPVNPEGDGGPAKQARLFNPFDVSVDASGNVYIADTYNHRIRKVDKVTGIITTVTGTGVAGYGDGVAVKGKVSSPSGLAVDLLTGKIYIADTGNNRIRSLFSLKIVPL